MHLKRPTRPSGAVGQLVPLAATRRPPLVVVTVAMLTGLAANASPATSAPISACTTTSGVTVVADFSHWGIGVVRGCAAGTPATGYDALIQAGFTAAGTLHYGNAFVCRINNLPVPADDPCIDTPPAGAYWAYYHAQPGDTGWSYSTVGVMSYHPKVGSVEAWAFGSDAQPSVSPSSVLPSSPPPPTVPTAQPPAPASGTQIPPSTARSHVRGDQTPTSPRTAPGQVSTSSTSFPSVQPDGAVSATAPSQGPDRFRAGGVTIRDIAGARHGQEGLGSPLPALAAAVLVLAMVGAAAVVRRRRNRPE